MLLERGADINGFFPDKQTALHWAARVGNAEAVRWLLGKGAKIDAKDEQGRTPLGELIRTHSSSEVFDSKKLKGFADTYKTLLNHDADDSKVSSKDVRSFQILLARIYP